MTPVRLLLLAVVLGVALMHHLGGAASEGGSGCGGSALSSTPMSMPAHDDAPVAPRHGAVPGPDGGGMLHLCQAVLTDVAGVVVVLVLLGVPWAPTRGRHRVRPTGGGHSRAPPVPLRLAALGVLRV